MTELFFVWLLIVLGTAVVVQIYFSYRSAKAVRKAQSLDSRIYVSPIGKANTAKIAEREDV